MRADDLIEEIEMLRKVHGNCYVIIDSNYQDEVSVDKVDVIEYHETKYFVIKG